MIIRSVAVVWAIIGSCACTTRPQAPSAQAIYAELVDAGCIAPSDTGAASAAQGLAMADAQPPWFGCLAEGGSVASCAVPCDR